MSKLPEIMQIDHGYLITQGLPRLTKKLRKQLEGTSAANELLYKLGHNNGTN